ncbi:MAG: amidohydrolase family protein [Candidatus Marinimicrobia bacterium]|jgi:imidazolonepropionase-like amidohydrolase|nr:amidohydrolase family protein [Candidatus Neomarinimicrobiota bacterium]MDP6611155.1 amidohydrolase family protein [Candidatus Neomarinimicrobiota bacterium]|tara:strand:- start:11183 stop:12502 length:1320 start_codon:yes stop_codon:yes gene_type:complete
MKRIILTLIFSSFIFANDQIPAPPQKHPILLKNGIIHTVSNGVINGSILFDKGKITHVGEYISPPAGAEVIDLEGKHVYPGFIAAVSGIGLVEINAVDVTNDHSERGDFNPNVRANVAYNPDSEIIPTTRSNGVLIANVAPSSGLVSGQSSIMMMDGWTWEDATFAHPSGLHVNWPGMGIQSGGRFRMPADKQKKRRQEALKGLDDMIKEGRAYTRLRQTQSRKAEDYHHEDLRLESLIPYVQGKRPIYVHANEVRQIEAAVHWANRHEVKIIIVGGKDAWRTTDLLRINKVPVIYEGVTALPNRRFEDYDQAYKGPALLHEAGVQFCIASSGSAGGAYRVRNLPNQAAMAAAYGLPKDAALRSITLSAAEVIGIADRAGSLESGKDATLFISTGDPLEIRTNVLQAYIQGRKIDMNDHHKSLYHKYQEKYRQLGILEE